ncbi:substrate-specific activator of APC-dependent proteolysis, partial [Chytridiales sp. JEL 0842]
YIPEEDMITYGQSRKRRKPWVELKDIVQIPKVPYRVLDAPNLSDDFYLNVLDWSANGVVAVGLGEGVHLWNDGEVTSLCYLEPGDQVTCVKWSRKGDQLAVGTKRGVVELYNITQMRKIREFLGHLDRASTLAWSENLLTSAGRDKAIFHRDPRAPEQFVSKLVAHRQEVCGLEWNSTQTLLASGSNDNTLLIWDSYSSETPLHTFTEHRSAVKAIAWCPNNAYTLASGGGTHDRQIRFWCAGTGTPLSSIDTGAQVCSLAWAKNGHQLVSGHAYQRDELVVWGLGGEREAPTLSNLATVPLGNFPGYENHSPYYLAESPDGQSVVTAGGDETVRFWNVFMKKGMEDEKEEEFVDR